MHFWSIESAAPAFKSQKKNNIFAWWSRTPFLLIYYLCGLWKMVSELGEKPGAGQNNKHFTQGEGEMPKVTVRTGATSECPWSHPLPGLDFGRKRARCGPCSTAGRHTKLRGTLGLGALPPRWLRLPQQPGVKRLVLWELPWEAQETEERSLNPGVSLVLLPKPWLDRIKLCGRTAVFPSEIRLLCSLHPDKRFPFNEFKITKENLVPLETLFPVGHRTRI